MRLPAALPRLFKSESIWQLMDQGAVSGGNFLTNLALARTLTPDVYGTFSLLFISLLGLNTIHASFVVFPLTLTTAKEPHQARQLAGEASLQTALVLPLQALLLLVTTVLIHRVALLPLLALTLFAWQLQETTRRALLANQRPRAAFFPDALSYVGQGALVLLLRPHTLVGVLLIMLCTSLLASAIQHGMIRTSLSSAFQTEHLKRSWKLGSYTLAANALTMVGWQLPSWTLALNFGRSTVADFQALYNIVGMANPILFSVGNMLIPAVARNASRGVRAARSTALRHGVQFASLLVLPAILLLLFPGFSMRLIYGAHSPYLPFAYLLRYFVPMLLLDYATIVIGAYEGGSGRPQSYMYVQIVATAVLLAVGLPLILALGLHGAAIAGIVVSAFRVLTFALVSRRNDARSLKPSLTHLASAKEVL